MAERRRMPRSRGGKTTSFSIGGELKGYLTVGEYEDGTLGEIFLKVAKMGSTLGGMTDAFAIMVSLALQYGVPLKVIVEHLSAMHFEPFGSTNDEETPKVKSLIDYIARRLAMDYLPPEEVAKLFEVSVS